MPTYFDTIEQNSIAIDQSTLIYLIKIEDKFALKAISGGLEQLMVEPTTRATTYWMIDTIKLLDEQRSNQLIFPENQLTTKPLALNQVTEYLGINPRDTIPTRFGNKIAPPELVIDDTLRNSDVIPEDDITSQFNTEIDDWASEAIGRPQSLFNNFNFLRPLPAPIVNIYDSTTTSDHGRAQRYNTILNSSLLFARAPLAQPIVDLYGNRFTSQNHIRRTQPDRFFFPHECLSAETSYTDTSNAYVASLQTLIPTFLSQSLTFALYYNIPIELLFNQHEETTELYSQISSLL